jgi:prophage antirepressor-like protein
MDKTFFLDIFNKLLKYGDKEISIIFDSNGDVWFGLRDTLKVLEYTSLKKTIYNISKQYKKKYKDLRGFKGVPSREPPCKKPTT